MQERFMAFYYTSDKLQTFFLSLGRARCHFSDAHFIIYCNSCAGDDLCTYLTPLRTAPSIHLFPEWLAKKLVYIPNCWCSFLCSAVVFLHFRQTHIHMCINIANIRLHNFFFSFRFFLPPMQIYTFCPARPTLFDSLMVKWLYGLVWSVVCYFNFLCLLLAAAGWCCGDGRTSGEGKKCILFMCGIFSMMTVVCERGRKK